MGRSNTRRRKQKAARGNLSNRRLPTFVQTPLTSYIDQMISPVFDPEISSYTAPPTGVVPFTPAGSTPRVQQQKLWGPSVTPSKVAREVGTAAKASATATAGTPLDICTSRSIREEVIHATGKSGRRGQKRPRWTEKSRIKC